MLGRTLLLFAVWLVLSFTLTLLRGTKVHRGTQFHSLAWLAAVLVSGSLWALLTFGVFIEVALVSVATFIIGWWWIRRLPNWNALGQTLWVVSLLTVVVSLVYSFTYTVVGAPHPVGLLLGAGLFFIQAFAFGLALTYTYETLDVCCRIHWHRRHEPAPMPGYMPKVSLHVPAYNEPPEVVEATLRALARLDYPNYEVLLVDNNTPDEAAWRPLEKVCRELGTHFRCLHLDKWPGYKAGALNFALAQTAPDAEIIGIIDADYEVLPNFLQEIVPFFADPQVGFVQTPQDYRDFEGNTYLEACYYAYKYFFEVAMPARNEYNAIIFGGTMGLIRRSVLQEIGGWDEWCITEDAECSLRVLKHGYQSYFVNQTYGRGLMPFTFEGLKKQRFRWCFGGIHILKKHWEALMPWAHWLDPENRLTVAQRYHYLAGGLQWFNELLSVYFTLYLIAGGLIQLSPVTADVIRPITGPLMIVPAVFIMMGIWRFVWVLRHILKLSWVNALKAMTNAFSLGWAVALGCIQGVIQPNGVFLRTPKSRSKSGIIRAFSTARWETGIGMACILVTLILLALKPEATSALWVGLLLWQAVLYLTAPFYSLLSTYTETSG